MLKGKMKTEMFLGSNCRGKLIYVQKTNTSKVLTCALIKKNS